MVNATICTSSGAAGMGEGYRTVPQNSYGPNPFLGIRAVAVSSADYEYDRFREIMCKVGEVFCALESAG
jgi:hypothetical protein